MSRRLFQLGFVAARRASFIANASKAPNAATQSLSCLCSGQKRCSSSSQSARIFEEKIAEVHPGKRVINYNELCTMIGKGSAILIDVRDSSEYAESGHIANAVNIPLTELKSALKMPEGEFEGKYGIKKPKTSSDNVVFYGLSDVLSAAASEIAHNLGYKKCKCYPEGWAGWCAMLKTEAKE